MVDTALVSSLLTEAAGFEDSIEQVARQGDALWSVVVDGTMIEISSAADSAQLHLLSEIGPPPEDNRLYFLELMLSYNFLWRETGVHTALSGPDGEAILTADIDLAGMTPSQMAIILKNFSDRAITWKALFGSEELVDADPEDAPFDGMMMRI